MGSIYVRQPNGKIARFSTIVDMFTDLNLSAVDAMKMAVKEVGKDQCWDLFGSMGNAGKYSECLDTIRIVHGEKMYAKVMELANEQTTWTAKLVEVDDVSSVCQPPS